MNAHYVDILDLTARAPLWFDENAVPRFCAFAPRQIANIYAEEAVLLRIRCQGCTRRFDVCMSLASTDILLKRASAPLADQIRARTIHYGDPPNVRCCPAGPTMNSEPERVLEFWRRVDFEWTRDASLEVDVEDVPR